MAFPPTHPNATLTVDYLDEDAYEGTMLTSGTEDLFTAAFYDSNGDLVDQLVSAKVVKSNSDGMAITGLSSHLRRIVGVTSAEEAEVQWKLRPSRQS